MDREALKSVLLKLSNEQLRPSIYLLLVSRRRVVRWHPGQFGGNSMCPFRKIPEFIHGCIKSLGYALNLFDRILELEPLLDRRDRRLTTVDYQRLTETPDPFADFPNITSASKMITY